MLQLLSCANFTLTDRRFWETCCLHLNFITPWTPAPSLRRGRMFLQTSLHIRDTVQHYTSENNNIHSLMTLSVLVSFTEFQHNLTSVPSNCLIADFLFFFYSEDLSNVLCWQHVLLMSFCYSLTRYCTLRTRLYVDFLGQVSASLCTCQFLTNQHRKFHFALSRSHGINSCGSRINFQNLAHTCIMPTNEAIIPAVNSEISLLYHGLTTYYYTNRCDWSSSPQITICKDWKLHGNVKLKRPKWLLRPMVLWHAPSGRFSNYVSRYRWSSHTTLPCRCSLRC